MTVPSGVETPIPAPIPSPGLGGVLVDPNPETLGQDYSSYDIAVGGLGFRYATSVDNPLLRQTAEFERTRIDQAAEPGEQTLTGWWQKSQSSFHGGAGQKNLEPPFPSPPDRIRFDTCKNVDVFTPGQVTRLSATRVLLNVTPVRMCGVYDATDGDCVAYVTASGGLSRVSLTGVQVNYTAAPANILAVATDGSGLYVASAAGVWRVNSPGSVTQLHSFTGTNVTLGWAKARLMLAVDNAVYEIAADGTASTALGATQLRYTHPTASWQWKGFAEAPQAVLAYGQNIGRSDIVSFTLTNTGGVPVLSGGAVVATLPPGELILDALSTQGNLLTLATTQGVRCGQYDALYGSLSLGPLSVIGESVSMLAARDRFIFGAGLAGDEPGLVRLDRGTLVDSANRVAWAPDLIGPDTPTDFTPSKFVVAAPLSGRLVFHLTGVGLVVEDSTVDNVRPSWLRTSRIRFDTTEPKLFKRVRVRGDSLSDSEIDVIAITASGSRSAGITGFLTGETPEFSLPSAPVEWMQLQFTLMGDAILTGYGVKALPGVRRERIMQFVLSCYDQETDKYLHQSHGGRGSARLRLLALEALDAAGDEVMLEEYTSQGVNRTRVTIVSMQYQQTGRPTPLSDAGGTIKLQLRTVS